MFGRLYWERDETIIELKNSALKTKRRGFSCQ